MEVTELSHKEERGGESETGENVQGLLAKEESSICRSLEFIVTSLLGWGWSAYIARAGLKSQSARYYLT